MDKGMLDDLKWAMYYDLKELNTDEQWEVVHDLYCRIWEEVKLPRLRWLKKLKRPTGR